MNDTELITDSSVVCFQGAQTVLCCPPRATGRAESKSRHSVEQKRSGMSTVTRLEPWRARGGCILLPPPGHPPLCSAPPRRWLFSYHLDCAPVPKGLPPAPVFYSLLERSISSLTFHVKLFLTVPTSVHSSALKLVQHQVSKPSNRPCYNFFCCLLYYVARACDLTLQHVLEASVMPEIKFTATACDTI